MNYYKILNVTDDNRLVSSFVEGVLQKKYSRTQYNTPNSGLWNLGYGLFVYTDLEVAKANMCKSQQLYKVNVGSVKSVPASLSSEWELRPSDITNLLQTDAHAIDISLCVEKYYYGSVVVTDSVLLISRLV